MYARSVYRAASVLEIQQKFVSILTDRPGSSEVPLNPLTGWDVSSIPANGIFLTEKLKIKLKMPNGLLLLWLFLLLSSP